MPVLVGRTKIGTTMSYLCPSCQPTPKPSRQISARISKQISAKMSKHISARISKQISSKISKQISTKISKQISTLIPNHWHQHVSPMPQLCLNSTTRYLPRFQNIYLPRYRNRYPPRYQNDQIIHVLVFHAALQSCNQPDLSQCPIR